MTTVSPSNDFHSLNTAFPFSAALAAFTSEHRLYDIDTPLGPSQLLVESWVGREELSTLYEWQIFCLAADAAIELNTLLARQVTLRTRLADGTQATRSGWVVHIAQLDADGGFARYCLTVVPWLWLATQRRQSRAFQDKTVLQILEDVFTADGPRANWRIAPEVHDFLSRVRPRSYCCQYRESDYAFFTRLLAEEGIGFYFEEVEETGSSISNQRLVLFADSTALADDYSAATHHGIRFHRDAGTEQQDCIQAFGSERRLQAAITTVSTWDYKAKRVIAASLPTAHRFGADNAPHVECNDWAGIYAFATLDEAQHYARILRQATDARFKTWFGQGSVRTFRAGTAFELTESPLDLAPGVPRSAQRRRFTLLGALHAGVNNLPAGLKDAVAARLGPLELGGPGQPLRCGLPPSRIETESTDFLHATFPGLFADDDFDDADTRDYLNTDAWDRLLEKAQATGYINRFTAIRADIPWRPALYDGTGALLNPKPTAWGTQTAIVVGPDGTTAHAGTVHTDHLGRIRLRFHWQTAEANGCWVRVAQLFAGPGYGAQFIPRIGQEVAVKFLENDIDRPVVTHVLYNGQGQTDGDAFAQAGDHAPAGQDNKIGSGASPAWHGAAAAHRHAGSLSGFKSVALGADGYTRQTSQLVFDDTTGRLRTKLSTDTAATQLNLGHLIHQADNYRGRFRGTGWEVRTDAYGALRAAKGLVMTTYYGNAPGGQPEPAGDNTPGIALMKQAKGFADTFNRAIRMHQTVQFILVKGQSHNGETSQSRIDKELAPLDAMLKALSGLVDAQDGSIDSHGKKIPHMHQPLVVVTAQPGIGVAAADGVHVAAGEVAHVASGRDAQLAASDTLSVHSGQAIGLLAGAVSAGDDGAGIKLYAGQGDVELQAQSDELILAAQELIKLISADSHIDLAAAKSIELCTEGGASVMIEGGNITFAAPGTISINGASKRFTGPARMNPALPEMPVTDASHTKKFVLQGLDGKPIEGASITLFDPEEKKPKWSSELANGHSLPVPEQEGPGRYAAVMGFKESVFHFHDMQEHVSDESEDEIFEDEHHERIGE